MISLKLIFTFILSFIFIKLLIKYAKNLNLVDIPNERSVHKNTTPRGAGIAFGFAFFISILLFHIDLIEDYWAILLSVFLVFLVGIWDDLKDTKPRTKFFVIFVAVFILYLDDITITNLGIYLGIEISLWHFALPFTMFALAGFTNALNLIDGVDGLAATISMIILGSFLYIGFLYEDALIIHICSIVMVSLFVFLLFNWNPAKIFMGDSGSLFLGFTISVVAVLSLKYIHPISILYLAALPIMDTLIVMVRRMRRKLSPFRPDKTHIHHILLDFFSRNVKRTVLFLALMQILFSLVGLMLLGEMKILPRGLGVLSFFSFLGINVLFYMIFTGMKRRQKLINRLNFRKTRPKNKK